MAVDPIEQSDDAAEGPETTPVTKSSSSTAREVLEAAGGVIERNADGQPAGVDLSGTEITMTLMQAVGELGEIQWLDLRGADVTDEHLSVVKRLPRLQLLALGDTDVTDEGLKSLRGLQELRFLSLDGTQVSDAGLMQLSSLPSLEESACRGRWSRKRARSRLRRNRLGAT